MTARVFTVWETGYTYGDVLEHTARLRAVFNESISPSRQLELAV